MRSYRSIRFLFTVIFAILTAAGLAFLGLADVSRVVMGDDAVLGAEQFGIPDGRLVVVCPPGLCIALVGTSLALLNFGIDEFVNPRLRTVPVPRGSRRKRHAHASTGGGDGGSRSPAPGIYARSQEVILTVTSRDTDGFSRARYL